MFIFPCLHKRVKFQFAQHVDFCRTQLYQSPIGGVFV